MGTKISELPNAGALTGGDELIPIVQDGDTVKTTVQDIADYAGSSAVWGGITGDITDQTDLVTALNLKVDAVPGKGLSANDFTNTLKTKLDGIENGAEVNVNADWNATSGDAQILNKPTIPSAQVNSDWNATSGVAEILNKPTIPSAVTNTSDLINDGEDGVNPFITALDIPTAGQAGTLVREVKNMTGATLTKGTVVYISGANGNKPIVSKALAVSDALSSRTFGLLQSDILDNGVGYCVVIGDLSGLDTSAFTEGAQLYLSGTVAGTYTDTKTLAPTHLVYVGKVTRSHPTMGQIEVQIQNGYELNEIHDVAISSPTNNDALVYESSTSLWKNKALTTAEVAESTDRNYVTDAEAVVIGNTSGTNTGDQNLSGLLEKSGGSLTGQLMYATPVTLASASTVNLASAGSNIVYISGTTAITSFGTSAETNLIYVKFLGTLTLTNNASFLLLPGFANITTAANDEAVMLNLGGGLWKCISYVPFSVSGTGAQLRQASPTLTGNPTVGNSTGASTLNLGTGANGGTSTKTVNIGTNGLSGTTTNINIGSAVSGSTTTTTVNGKLVANNISGILIKKIGASGTIATTTESIIGNVEILGGTLASTDILNITSRVRKAGNNNTYSLRYYLNTTSGSLTGATQIGIATTQSLGSIISAEFSREFIIDGGNLMGFPFATASMDGITASSSVGTVAYNVATTYYIITTVTLVSALDTASLIGQKVTNI